MSDHENDSVLEVFTIPAGTIVKVNGIPIRIESSVDASTHPGNIKLAFPKGVPSE